MFLLPRLLTALVGIPLILCSIYFGVIPFFILMLGIVLFSMSEYFFLLGRGGYGYQPVFGYVFAFLIFISVFLIGTGLLSGSGNQFTAAFLTATVFFFFLWEILRKRITKSIERIGLTLLGVFLISWNLSHLLLIRDIRPPYGLYYTLYIFILLWLADSFAYFFGVRFGRSSFASKISPKKTVEGFFGSILGGLVVGMSFYFICLKGKFSPLEMIFVSGVIVVIANLSDLSESLIKRQAGVKDSDVLLPGHGGMLDRFDSFLFTSPFFYYYLSIFHR